jgi:hypothetical protein
MTVLDILIALLTSPTYLQDERKKRMFVKKVLKNIRFPGGNIISSNYKRTHAFYNQDSLSQKIQRVLYQLYCEMSCKLWLYFDIIATPTHIELSKNNEGGGVFTKKRNALKNLPGMFWYVWCPTNGPETFSLTLIKLQWENQVVKFPRKFLLFRYNF